MVKVYLKKKISSRIANGHPWIFQNEVDRVAGNVEAGDIVEVVYCDGKFAGRGYINPKSQILVRLLTRIKQETINEQFFHDRIDRAEALQWMFFEQHALEPNIGAAYFWLSLVRGGRELHANSIEDWMERGHRALQVMDNHLKTHNWFAANHFTVADIALYAYTHVAEQCDFELSSFPSIRLWLDRVSRQPGFVTMDWQADTAHEDRVQAVAG